MAPTRREGAELREKYDIGEGSGKGKKGSFQKDGKDRRRLLKGNRRMQNNRGKEAHKEADHLNT